MLADTHAHLYWDSFQDDLDQVIKRAKDSGVSYIINIGVNVETSQKALEQVKTYIWPEGLQVYSTIGIHPHEVQSHDVWIHDHIGELEKIYRSNLSRVIAIGECGLDYVGIDDKVKQLQRQLFQAQINLAKKLDLPLIVHCRESWDDVIKMTQDHFGIYHCYSGLPPTTSYLLPATSFLVSFACNVTYPKNDYLLEAIKHIPLDRIVLETDSPFLPPQIKRGQRNEPANVTETAKVVAGIKNLTLEEVARQTTANVVNLLSR